MADLFASEELQLGPSSPRFLIEMERGEVARFPGDAAFMMHTNGQEPQLCVDGGALYTADVMRRTASDQIVVGRVALSEVFDQPTSQMAFLVDLGALTPDDLPQYAAHDYGWQMPVAAFTERSFLLHRRHAPAGPYRDFVKLLMAHADGKTTAGLYTLSKSRRFDKRR